MIARRALLLTVLAPIAARANPPPPDSEDAHLLGRHGAWITAQHGPLGSCCGIGDGRIVHVQVRDGAPWVTFLRPETIDDWIKPKLGVYYRVEPEAILRGRNPTGYDIAWWFGRGRTIHREHPDEFVQTNIVCFQPTDLY